MVRGSTRAPLAIPLLVLVLLGGAGLGGHGAVLLLRDWTAAADRPSGGETAAGALTAEARCRRGTTEEAARSCLLALAASRRAMRLRGLLHLGVGVLLLTVGVGLLRRRQRLAKG